MEQSQDFYNRNKAKIIFVSIVLLSILFIMPFLTARRMNIDSSYTKKEDVALYIMQYHELPQNYITHYGLEYAQSNHIDVSCYIVGGDTHFNSNQLNEFGVKRTIKLKECDILFGSYEITGNRGRERLVYTCNEDRVRVFYTKDHYGTFIELTSFKLNLTSNIFWIIFGVYCITFVVFYILVGIKNKKKGKNLLIENSD